MRDSELVLRFIAFDGNVISYRGDFKAYLDETTRYYESEWEVHVDELHERLQRLDLALETSVEIFGEYAFRKRFDLRHGRRMWSRQSKIRSIGSPTTMA